MVFFNMNEMTILTHIYRALGLYVTPKYQLVVHQKLSPPSMNGAVLGKISIDYYLYHSQISELN